jgi:hypothetical protein
MAHAFDHGHYKVMATLKDEASARVPPFEAIELDLADMLGMEQGRALCPGDGQARRQGIDGGWLG